MIDHRLPANREIIKRIAKMAEKYPDLRFVQLLIAMDIVDINRDDFNTESVETLNKMKTLE